MKKTIILFMLFISVYGMAQNYPITNINISSQASPDADMVNWANASSLFMISASAKTDKGRVDNLVMDSKILVTISGANACGSYTKESAPESNFNTSTKIWRGEAAVSLFGESCVLPPGNYEVCVQFFVEGAVALMSLSDKKCKSFTIKETENKIYQPPKLLAPIDGIEFNETGLKKPMTFRWMLVLPKPQEPVTYRLRVWQLLQGQTGRQAMRVNQPIIEKDVDNMTQIVVNNLIDGPCKLPYLCDFVWNVQALNREGKPIGENNGMSHAFGFNFPNIIEQKVTYNEACKYLSVDFMVDRKIYTGDSSGVEIYITNRNKLAEWKNKPTNFRIKIMSDAVIVNADQAPNGWMRTPSKFPPSSTEIIWILASGEIPTKLNLGSILFTNVKSGPISVQYEWLNKDDKVICSGTRTLDMTDLGSTQKVKLISPTDGHIGSAQVSVNLLQHPPNQLIETDLWNGTLTNTSKNTLHITLSGTLKSAAEGKVLEAQSKLITLPPGTKRITYDDVKSESMKTIFDRWGNHLTSNKNAPDGNYTICVFVKNEKGDGIASDCIEQKIRYDVSNAGTTQSLKLIGSFIVYKSNKSDQVIFKEFVNSNTNNTEKLIGKFIIEKDTKSDKGIFKNN